MKKKKKLRKPEIKNLRQFRDFAMTHDFLIPEPYLFTLPKTKKEALKDIEWLKRMRTELPNLYFEQ